MPAYARIAVNIPALTGVFDYSIPPELEGRIAPGHLVTVPFGRQSVQGVVLELAAEPSVAEVKPLACLLDPLPVLTFAQIDLAKRMAAATLNPLAAMLDLMLPTGLSQQADTLFSLASPRKTPAAPTPVQKRLLDLLSERGSLRGRQIDRHFKNVDWRRTAQVLLRSGLLTSQSVLPPPSVRPKYVRTAQLAVPPGTAEAALPELGRTAATLQRRQAALRCLMREPAEVDVTWVYAESGCNLADLQELAERELISLHENEIWRDPLEKVQASATDSAAPPELTPDQQTAWQALEAALHSTDAQLPFLLHGVTGSGKTELYLRAAADAVRRGRQAIVLVPEIAITPQMVRRFLGRFPGQVGLVHSRLSAGERYDTWRRARLGILKVVIGPRSALFTPLPDPGLIVVDECHDPSFHQSEPPFYHAVQAAQEYAGLCGAVCILGSATPSIVQRQAAENGSSRRLVLPRRIVQADLPPVQVVDMRVELKSGNRGIFSQALLAGLERVLQNGQQAILFLNRRGTASHVFCRECGYVARCPQCDSPLTQHSDEEAGTRLLCHFCGYGRGMPATCPQCAGRQIRAYGLGSEKVEAEVQAHFPSARTLRWDWDTTRQKDAHELILSHFAGRRADVLVGTQMLAKGLDLPLVTLVGIVLADVGLNLPDPFAAERTFNLLTQVAGRAGRSKLGGEVVLQTFQPEHAVIQAAASHDVDGFHRQELEQRRRLGYPPFARLVRLEFRHFEAARAETETRGLAERLRAQLERENDRSTTLIGPVPGYFPRLAGLHRWQIILRGPDPAAWLNDNRLLQPPGGLPKGWRVEVDPVSLL